MITRPALQLFAIESHEPRQKKRPGAQAIRMTGRRWLRLGAKALHEIASIGFGGGMAACLVINLVASRASSAEFAAARHAFAAIAQYVLLPSMAVVVLSGLIALAATRGYRDAGWAWLKALLGLSVFEATLLIVSSSRRQAELASAAGDPTLLDTLLRAERNTLWLLIALSVANVVLAVWRPRLTAEIR
jgi:uncharacterized membrane protein